MHVASISILKVSTNESFFAVMHFLKRQILYFSGQITTKIYSLIKFIISVPLFTLHPIFLLNKNHKTK